MPSDSTHIRGQFMLPGACVWWLAATTVLSTLALPLCASHMDSDGLAFLSYAQRQTRQSPTDEPSMWNSINEFCNNALDADDFPPRWKTGNWSAAHGWMHITSDLAIWLSYLVIPIVAIYFVRRVPGFPHSKVLLLFSACIVACGFTHLMEALMFSWPAYRLMGLIKAGAALTSIISTVFVIPIIPKAMTLRSPIELEREIVQRRRTESELRQVHGQLEGVIELRTAELASKNEEMEQFLNTVSHDLKSPVVTCLGLTRMIRDDLKAGHMEETHDAIDRIDRSINRMRQLIEDLLDLSSIGKVSFDIVSVDVGMLITSIVDDLRPRVEQAGATLQIENELPRVQGDAHWLTEVFENLIINAIKYGCDAPHPRIVIGSTAHGVEYRVYVRDNGNGIDATQHARIFEPFRRLRSEKEGNGMGLAIVMRIIKMHGGRVWIESEPGNGATFWVALPAATSSNNVDSQHSTNTPQIGASYEGAYHG